MLYSRGTQGDYLALQLKDNRMILNIDLGSRIMTSLSVGSLLDDNVWHDVVISRNRRDIIFSVDRVIVQGRLKAEFNRLNLNRAVSMTMKATRMSLEREYRFIDFLRNSAQVVGHFLNNFLLPL